MQDPESTVLLNLHPWSHCLPLTVERASVVFWIQILNSYFLGGSQLPAVIISSVCFIYTLWEHFQTIYRLPPANHINQQKTTIIFLSMSLTQMGPAKNGMLFPQGNTYLPKIRPWANWNSLLYQDSPLLLKNSFRQLTCFFYCLASLSTLATELCSPFTITFSLSCHNATFSLFPLYLHALCWIYLPFLYLPLNVDF